MIVDEKKEASADLMRKYYSEVVEKEHAVQRSHDFLEAYKQGYLDGYIGYMQERKGRMTNEQHAWKKLHKMCAKAFNTRFIIPAQKRLIQSEKEVENGNDKI